MAIGSRVDDVDRSDQYQDVKLEELRLVAVRIATALNIDDVPRFLRNCGFKFKKPTPQQVSAERCGND
jgi:hypothetical protein